MKDYRLIDKIKYWLDKQMSKGTVSIIRLMSLAVLSVVVFVSVLIVLFKLRDGFFSAFWDSLATIVNAWMPSSEDGQVGFILLNTLTAIIGLFFTSILIGVISSGIEEKLENLRNGNSIVLEKDHTVILGYNLGEHGLLKQLILANENRKRCIVIFTDITKSELEQDLQDNIDIPKNIEVICRHGDITNVNDLKCCSIEKARIVIVNALNDNRRIKAILAVSKLKKMHPECDALLIACVTNEHYLLPQGKIDKKNIIMLKTDDIMAKMIARTSTEPGLSIAFKELLNFEGNELYFERDDRFPGKSVLELAGFIDDATLVGIERNGKTILNPKRDVIVKEEDELLLFETSKGSYSVNEVGMKNVSDREVGVIEKSTKGHLYIFGSNILLKTIIDELPPDVEDITIFSKDADPEELAGGRYPFKIKADKRDYANRLPQIASSASHIIILADREIDKEDSDIDNILLLLKLMDIKERNGYLYNIAVELNMASSYNVSVKNDKIDYIVASDIASLVLAQMSENTKLESVFEELLSKKGNELYSKPIRQFNLSDAHDYSYGGLKQIVLSYGYTLLGYCHENEMNLNLKLEDRVELSDSDSLIVLGKE
ncbi:MAG: hypothetical protein IKS51_07940 [Erysipelotrichaceae bacterium]|nr:hypothetical protein [Erysipelotrichaceae bacterium]